MQISSSSWNNNEITLFLVHNRSVLSNPGELTFHNETFRQLSMTFTSIVVSLRTITEGHTNKTKDKSNVDGIVNLMKFIVTTMHFRFSDLPRAVVYIEDRRSVTCNNHLC